MQNSNLISRRTFLGWLSATIPGVPLALQIARARPCLATFDLTIGREEESNHIIIRTFADGSLRCWADTVLGIKSEPCELHIRTGPGSYHTFFLRRNNDGENFAIELQMKAVTPFDLRLRSMYFAAAKPRCPLPTPRAEKSESDPFVLNLDGFYEHAQLEDFGCSDLRAV